MTTVNVVFGTPHIEVDPVTQQVSIVLAGPQGPQGETGGGVGGAGAWGDITGTLADQTDLQAALDAKQATSQKGQANGYAELDASGLVPIGQIPGAALDVQAFANVAAFPVTGETDALYIANDTNLTYRWSGSAYVEISASLALGETSATAYRGDRGKTAYDHSQLTSGNPHAVSKSDVGLGNVDNTSDANKPVSSATQTALDAKLAILTGITVIAATNNLSTARPAGIGVGYWLFDDPSVDPGASGENIVNGVGGDLWFVPDA